MAYGIMKLRKIATPPKSAVGFLLHLSSRGLAIQPFIMAILHPPKLLLLDEPTAALDPSSATKLLRFAQNYTRENGISTILITHDPMIAKHLGNRLWILEEGTIKREFGIEKNFMDPQDFFHPLDYTSLTKS